ncbi:hypothetical protein HX744_28010 [Pseudonocardia sp. ICBG1122]|nr:hypothetical protein [Pseudonocardia pini]
MRVYAGQDPITELGHNLVEIVPAGPDAGKQAYAVRDRMLRDIGERRSPRTT